MSGLIVPVDVLACCVGTGDAHGPARSFAGATTDYRNQTTDARPAFLGINVTRDPDAAPSWPLESGVHLHWAMPDALTRAHTGPDAMSFPALPNRWLVTRVVGAGQAARHWIIRSDELSEQAPEGKPVPTVPVAEPGKRADGGPSRGFRYLGAREVFQPPWSEPAALPDVPAADLHAVATGDIAFAAFYPSSRSSFGFHDDLADLTATPAELMYVVTGWYAAPGHDPVHAGLSPAQLQEQLRWTVGPPSAAPVAYSLYSGLIQGIRWDPDTRYLADDPEPIRGDVAIGNHPAEALAAYLRGTSDHPALAVFEELLTLYLAGLLPSLTTPAAGQLAQLEQALHELQFAGFDGGTIYTITRGGDEVTGLPLPLADALNLLNTRQQAADVAAAQVPQAKWQLFSSWYRLFEVTSTDDQNAALGSFTAHYERQPAIAERAASTARAAATQKAAVEQMLGGDLVLTAVPAARYYTPTEPVVLLAGQAAAPAARYGGDGRYHPDGHLACRLGSEVLTGLAVAPSATLGAAQFAALTPAAPDQLPYPEIAALVQEAALLNAAIGAAASGVAEPDLAGDLAAWLEGGTARYYSHPAGTPPSPVAAARWPGANPWLSLALLWEAQFHPLLDTSGGTAAGYPPGFFTENYRLEPGNPRLIGYVPAADGIGIDPATIDFTPDDQSGTCRYTGWSVLSTTAADNLRTRLAQDPATVQDATLEALSGQLARTDIAMQGLAGFNDALLTRQPSIQLSIGVSSHATLQLRSATRQVASEITSLRQIPPLAPQFGGHYNGVRAGYLKLSLRVMDPFGRKRPVCVDNLYLADSLTTVTGGAPVPGVIYAQPRLAQHSRLLYRWLAADSTGYDEMNVHPATTPVCGWLLPDHLSVGFFLYNAQGDPLGSLTRRADGSGIAWQAAPGRQATIDADLATVMAGQNPHLRELGLALGAMTPRRFRAFWQAADAAVTQIVPSAPASSAGLAALVGRPLALVQASLRLERHGLAARDQRLTTPSGGRFAETDHGIGAVRFPVVLGDLRRLDDGLVGYFKQAADDGYDTATFYSQAATGDDPGVVVPSPANLLLGAQATAETDPDAPAAGTAKLLMLVDPRAPVHATTGILPTQSLAIPPGQYEDILAGLELTFPARPLLRPGGGLAVPVPALAGYEWSWITEEAADPGLGPGWAVDPGLEPVTAGAVWQYSPQTLTEGWLRLNPQLLRFRLAAGDHPVVTAGATVSLDLSIKNTRGAPVTFTPAALTGETSLPEGSIFYIHFGPLVDAAQVGAMRFTASGWRFGAFTDARYGSYWAAAPDRAPVTLAPGQQLTMTIANVAISAGARAQGRVHFDYYNLAGLDDGVDVDVLTVTAPGRLLRLLTRHPPRAVFGVSGRRHGSRHRPGRQRRAGQSGRS